MERKKRRVKVVTSVEEQARILRACHSDPTSGHFGTTKTWRKVAERFYWHGMANQVKEMVSYTLYGPRPFPADAGLFACSECLKGCKENS